MMDWKAIVDQFDPMTCVISVEKTHDGGYGTIRIVTGNQSYVDSIATAAGGVDPKSAQKKAFVPDSEYTRYIPKDLNFEEVCYRCAILKQPMENCVHMPRYPFDINAYLIPMKYEDEDRAYCTYSQVFIPKTEKNLLAKNISLDTAMDVISTCVKLRGKNDFHESMNEVVEDIRRICGADNCCVLLMDGRNRACSILAEAKSPDSTLPWMRTVIDENFYGMAETWLETIGGSYCLAISDRRDMEYLRERNPAWHQSLTGAGIESLVIFPLFSQEQLLGFIWATNFDTHDIDRIKDTLELTTIYIASEISEKFFEEEPSEQGGVRDDRLQKVDHIISGLSEDMNQHLSKPVDSQRLFEVMGELIYEAEQGR